MASKEFQFHYVKTPTGSISGQSVLTQTEDAINDLGDYMVDATADATEALNKATEALNTANTAQQNASEALSTANAASGKVNSLETVVNSWDATIKDSNAKASQAVSTANAANTKSAQAVSTANSANTKSDQAVKTANTASSTANTAKTNSETAVADALEAKEIAKEAKAIAEEAVVDSDADVATMRQLLAETKAQAQNASTSAAASQSSANESADYSTLSQAWAVKMDGKVTEGNVPDGTEVDYSSKYYAQQAKASADAADASEASALSSKNAAASSAAAAKTSETNAAASKTSAASSASAASTSATNAANSQKAAASSATSAANAQKAAEAARDLAQQYASQNAYAVVYDAQTLTTAQQAQARKNIGAISAAEAPAPDLTPYLTKADAASTYLGINAKAKTAGTADTVPWTGVSGKPNLVRSVNGISPGTDGNVTIPIPARMMPNYGSYVQIGAGDYTPSEDGWLRLENMNSGDYTGGKVIHKASGALILEFYQNRYPGNATMMLPVRARETYTVSNPGKIYFHKMM